MVRLHVPEHIDHVAEIFVVTALVRTDCDRVRVLLHGRRHDLGYAPVVAEMHDLRTGVLDQPSHDVDRRIVTIE